MRELTLFIKKFTAIIVLFMLTSPKGQAQQWLGISGSNYAGTHSIYNNPANVADSRYKLYANLAANDFFMANNYVGYNAPYSVFKLLTNSAAQEYRNRSNVIIFKNSYYDINADGEPFHLHVSNDLRGPSLLYTINEKRSIALLSRVRTIVNFTDVPLPLANLIRLGTDTLFLKNQNFGASNTALNVNSYAELGVAYGQVLKDEDEEFIKVGVTLKRVVGMYNAHLNIEEANYNISNDPSEPQKQILTIDKLKATYGYTTENAFSDAKLSPSWLFGNQSAGSGWGVDVGIVYEYRPNIRKYAYRQKGVQQLDPSKNKYEYRIGVSIVDIGGINYNNPFYARNWEVDVNDKNFKSDDVSEIKGLDDTFERINQVVGLTDDKSSNRFSVGLPTAFQINFDYHLRDNFYVNSVWVQGLKGKNTLSMQMPSSLSVTPRWEGKWIEVGVPFALLDNYHSFTFGIGFRLGPLFFGTDNLGSIFGISRPRGTDLYFGLSLPIFNRPPSLPNACFYEQKEGRGWKFWKKKT